MVGHSFEIDALITYLANNGDPTPEKFDQISEGIFINETELTKIQTSEDGTTVEYRGKKYPIKNEAEE
jgi:CRISPR/Cas system-associated endonuclease Cas1